VFATTAIHAAQLQKFTAQRLQTACIDSPSVGEVAFITNQCYDGYGTAITAQVCEPALDGLEAALKEKLKLQYDGRT
jgi:hypothetical protein